MHVSVVIPVYNAEKYLVKAVESALIQPQVQEILLVEDCSPDHSLKLCRSLEKKHSTIRVIRHPNGENLGAAESRNLGIRSASYEFIAFLDADDYYLPDRFEVAAKLFREHDDIEGVYEAIGMHYYDEDAREKWLSKRGEQLTTVSKGIMPNELFEKLLIGKNGYLHLDGLVVKKNIFERCGYFPTHLRLHQDTAIFLQLAGVGTLVSGRLDVAVANRGIHNENRILSNYDQHITRNMLWDSLFYWSLRKNLNSARKAILFRRYLISILHLVQESKNFISSIKYSVKLVLEFIQHPILSIRVMLSATYGK